MKNLHDYINGTLKQHADLVHLGLKSEQALEIVSYPPQLRAFRDTLRQMKVRELEELISRSKGIPIALTGKRSMYELTGIDPSEGMVFEYTDIPLGVDIVRVPIYEMTYNQIEAINKVIREVLK